MGSWKGPHSGGRRQLGVERREFSQQIGRPAGGRRVDRSPATPLWSMSPFARGRSTSEQKAPRSWLPAPYAFQPQPGRRRARAARSSGVTWARYLPVTLSELCPS